MLFCMFSIGAACFDIVRQTYGYVLGIGVVPGGRFGCAIAVERNEVFFTTFVLSFVSMMVSTEGGVEHAWKNRGYVWKGHEWKRIDLYRDQ